MKRLLQEFLDLKLYKNSLSEDLYREYKQYLCERILKEITVKGLSKAFKTVFKQNVKDSSSATIDKINIFVNAAQQAKYERKFGKIIPNGYTHLELKSENFCDKETFKKKFEKENFEEFEYKEDLAVKSTASTFLEIYLDAFTKDGWLISKVDVLD